MFVGDEKRFDVLFTWGYYCLV